LAELSITAVKVRISSGSAYAALSGHDVHGGGGQVKHRLPRTPTGAASAEEFTPVPWGTIAVGTRRERGLAAGGSDVLPSSKVLS
jgi:hypothetical protein